MTAKKHNSSEDVYISLTNIGASLFVSSFLLLLLFGIFWKGDIISPIGIMLIDAVITMWFAVSISSPSRLESNEALLVLIIIACIFFALLYITVDVRSKEYDSAQQKESLRKTTEAKQQAEQEHQAMLNRQKLLATLPPCEYKVVGKRIFSLERTNEIQGSISGESKGRIGGSFILGFGGVSGSSSGSISGSIGETTKYYFYSETKDGGYILDSVSASIPLYERDDIEPQLLYVQSPIREVNGIPICNETDVFVQYPNSDILFEGFSMQSATRISGGCMQGWCDLQVNGVSCGGGYCTTHCSDGREIRSDTPLSNCPSELNTSQMKLIVPIGTVRQQFKAN